jgi:uncharacterized protein YndB with AHSA1/START domain
MIGTNITQANCIRYEFEVDVNESIDRVWQAFINEINKWWLPDFRMVAPDSTIQLDVSAGGRGLLEFTKNGGFLKWFDVQFYLPERFTIYFVGQLSPDFGGPSTNHLKIILFSTGSGGKLQLTDFHVGEVNDATIKSLISGWQALFIDGLKAYVEKNKS